MFSFIKWIIFYFAISQFQNKEFIILWKFCISSKGFYKVGVIHLACLYCDEYLAGSKLNV